jgi:hypothetical protein
LYLNDRQDTKNAKKEINLFLPGELGDLAVTKLITFGSGPDLYRCDHPDDHPEDHPDVDRCY